MTRQSSRKTSFRKKYPSLPALIKKLVRSLLAVLLFLWRNVLYIILAILLIWLGYKVYSYLYERYLEDKAAYAPVQAERDADTRAVKAAAYKGEEEFMFTESEPVEWPLSADVAPDCKRIWPKEETEVKKPIAEEAKNCIDEITENVLQQQEME